MTIKTINLLLFSIFMCTAFSAKAGIMLRPSDIATVQDTTQNVSTLLAAEQSQLQKHRHSKKMIKQILKRVDKMNNSFGSVFASPRFRLGVLLLLLGIIGGILVNILTLAQIFGWLSGLVALAGLILMIMALIAHS